MEPARELELFRFLARVEDHLEGVRDVDAALKVAVRLLREFYGVDRSCVAVLPPGAERVELRLPVPRGSSWDPGLIAAFVRGSRPRLPRGMLLAAVRRRGRAWAALALERPGGEFDREDIEAIRRIAETVSKAVARVDRWRTAEVRLRIDQKIQEQLRPKDLFYQILHGLRSLTDYDHSASLSTHDAGTLELVAEQIAWRKAKSRRIGKAYAIDDEARAMLEGGEVFGFDRPADAWECWTGQISGGLAELLSGGEASGASEGPPRRAMLCAPLVTRNRLIGVLEISSCHAGALGRYEADLVQRFLPQAAVAITNLERTSSLETGMLEAEKKHVMADLARGVSHDINNALGSVLPLVQQMAEDARRGRLDAQVLTQDLEHVEASLQACRRVFSGMLSFARGAARRVGDGDLRRAAETTFSVLEQTLRRRQIRLRIDLPPDLPCVRCPQTDLERLLLNLATNACEAMPSGGELVVAARRAKGEVEISIRDTGVGIPPEDLARIEEPFFTTKPHGSGLGLAICRSIVWQNGGRMRVDSEPGSGTRIDLRLPASGAPVASEGSGKEDAR